MSILPHPVSAKYRQFDSKPEHQLSMLGSEVLKIIYVHV
jgi:hypothetical protein